MAPDIDISGWILEFMLRQRRLDDKIVNALVRVLPFPNENSNLKRVLIIRKIESEISNGSVTEKILELLELFEELDHQEGIEISVTMKSAYCAVAVECTVKLLKRKAGGRGEYFEAVRRIWKRRINVMEKMESVGFVSEEIRQWRDEIEAALWENRCIEYVIRRSEDVDGVDSVNAFVREVKERIGSPFLDVVAEASRTDDTLKKLLGGVNIEGTSRSSDRVVRTGNPLPRRKHVAFKRTRGPSVGTGRGVRISDSVEPGLEASGKHDDLLPTPKVQRAIEALKLSSLELHAVVKDPLPSALKFAETISSTVRDNMGQQPAENNSDRAPPPVADSSRMAQASEDTCDAQHKCRHNVASKSSLMGQQPAENDSGSAPPPVADSSRMAQANKDTCDAQHKCHHNVASKPSLMERQSTACTFEWDDSIDNSNEGSPSGARRFTLPSPKRLVSSPLKKYEFKKRSTRRKPMKWSTLEEDTLRDGVKKYGVGNWKLILDSYRDIFEARTAVDLKDKWRNLIS